MQRRHWRIFMGAALTLCVSATATTVTAQQPWQRNVQPHDKPVNALMRWVGFGYSDGYHAEYPQRAAAVVGQGHRHGPASDGSQGWTQPDYEYVLPSPSAGSQTFAPQTAPNYAPVPYPQLAPRQPTRPAAPPPTPQPSQGLPESLYPPRIELPRQPSQRSPSDLKPPSHDLLPAPPQLPRLPSPEPPPVVDPDAPPAGANPMQTRRRPYWWTR